MIFLNYSAIRKFDTSNGPGVRTSIFVSGCRHHCLNCFNQETWDFNFGQPFEKEDEDIVIDNLRDNNVNGLTILGGEPLEPENLESVKNLIKRVNIETPDKNIWLYSGFTYEVLEELRKNEKDLDEILNSINFLVEGPFIESKKDLTIKFRGSSNQRIYERKGLQLVERQDFK